MYENEIFEKVATRAWKKHWGGLSEQAQQTLVDKNIHNYDRYTDGLKKRTDAISKRYGTEFVTAENFFNKVPSTGSLVADKIRQRTLAKGGYCFFTSSDGRKFVMNDNNSKLFKKFSKNMTDNEKRQLHEILTAHEAVHEQGNARKMRISKRYGSHFSPGVIHGESADVALAYPKVKKAMEKMRKDSLRYSASGANYGDESLFKNIGSMFSSQHTDLRKAGVEYGKSPIVNKKNMKIHEDAFFSEKPMKGVTPIPRQKSRINGKAIAKGVGIAAIPIAATAGGVYLYKKHKEKRESEKTKS